MKPIIFLRKVLLEKNLIEILILLIGFIFLFSNNAFAISDTTLLSRIVDYLTLEIENDADRKKYLPISEKIEILISDIAEIYEAENEKIPNIIAFIEIQEGDKKTRKTIVYHWDKSIKTYRTTDYFIPGESYMIIHEPERFYGAPVGRSLDKETGKKKTLRYHKMRIGFNQHFQRTTSLEGIKNWTIAKDTTYIEKRINDKIVKQVLNFPIINTPKSIKENDKPYPITALRFKFNTEGASHEVAGIGLISTTSSEPLGNPICIKCKGELWGEACGSGW